MKIFTKNICIFELKHYIVLHSMYYASSKVVYYYYIVAIDWSLKVIDYIALIN